MHREVWNPGSRCAERLGTQEVDAPKGSEPRKSMHRGVFFWQSNGFDALAVVQCIDF